MSIETQWTRMGYLALSGEPHETHQGAADLLTRLLGRLKALFWYHWTAHWQTSGIPYYGDHLLFERLKDEVYEEIDPVAEMAVGYHGEEAVCPFRVMEHEHEGMTRIPDLVIRALEQERSFQALLSETIEQLEASGAMTPALDDLLPAMSRTHDSHIYLLQQRSKQASGNREAYFNSLERSWMGQSTFDPVRHAEDCDPEVVDSDWDEWEF